MLSQRKYVKLGTSSIYERTITMNVWGLIIEAFSALVERDMILSDRITELEKENGIEITDETTTSSQLAELVAKMKEHLAEPLPIQISLKE